MDQAAVGEGFLLAANLINNRAIRPRLTLHLGTFNWQQCWISLHLWSHLKKTSDVFPLIYFFFNHEKKWNKQQIDPTKKYFFRRQSLLQLISLHHRPPLESGNIKNTLMSHTVAQQWLFLHHNEHGHCTLFSVNNKGLYCCQGLRGKIERWLGLN